MDINSRLSIFSLPWLDWISVTVSVAFLSLIPIRLGELRGKPLVVRPSSLAGIKQCFAILCASVLLANLVIVARDTPLRPENAVRFAATALSFISGVGVGLLSFFDHRRSIRPSDTIVMYLVASLLVDSLHLWFMLVDADSPSHAEDTTIRSLLVCIVCKTILLIAEVPGKEKLLVKAHSIYIPEETAGILQRTFFWWLNPIIRRGGSGFLTEQDFQVIDGKLSSETLRQSISRLWDSRTKPETIMTLPWALFKCLGPSFVWAIPSRIFLILFQYGPPLLIKETIRSISQPLNERHFSPGTAWIIAVAVVFYVGHAICRAVYQHQQNKLRVMTRGALVGLVYNKTLLTQSNGYDLGRAVTLMNTDIDSLGMITSMAHDVWAHFFELSIGMVILCSQVGWLSLVPFVIILLCSRVSKYVAQNMHGRQKDWNATTQTRLSMINTVLGSIKTMKLLGVSGAIERYITSLRSAEIESAKKVRWIMITYNASANALGIFTPAITMMLYGALSYSKHSTIDAETAFTTIAVLSMVIHPANMIMTIIPRIVACFASFERIQTYLLEAPRCDQRVDLPDTSRLPACPSHATVAVCLEEVTVQADKTSELALDRVNMEIARSTIVVCTGPTGSGKTVLAKVLLGEVAPSQGTIKIALKRIGYCDQTPWLPNGTIRDVICNFADHIDENRYQSSIASSCLVHDLNQLPMGDRTEIGSRGLNLSGGQRQRMALARTLYDNCDMVILDDPFSALDGRTEEQVIENLFGSQGLFRTRKTTVLWITNGGHYFKLADSVVVLEKSRIKEHGHWSLLGSLPDENRKVLSNNPETAIQVNAQAENLEVLKKIAKELDTRLDLTRKVGNLSIYSYYIRSVGLFGALLMVSCTAIFSFFNTLPYYWIKLWMEADVNSAWFYIAGYGLFALLAWLATNGTMSSTFLLVTPKSGQYIHSKLLGNILGAPLAFFATTDIGVILNRFSQDIQLVDRDLPLAFQTFATQICKILVQISLLLAVQKLLLLSLPLCFIVIYFVARVFLRTSRQVRIEELASRSAVFSHIIETVEGIVTIRAFGWQDRCQTNLDHVVDISQGPLYLASSLNRWLTLVLDLMIAVISITVISLALFMRDTDSGAVVGVALNIIIVTNATVLRLVESWADFEISLGAIERLKTLDDEIPKEEQPGEEKIHDISWPQRGEIVIDHVTAAYNERAVALRDISLPIKAGQKVVVCGRTGSGKSTLLLSLLRVIDTTGKITVDGVDLSGTLQSEIRHRCFITVPQDPMLLPDVSLRFSLDPSGEADTSTIVEALKKTGVWGPLCSFNAEDSTDVLCRKVSELPALSVGQAQLLGLTRALVKKTVLGAECKPIVLLDEATSSLDMVTESLIYQLIDEEFVGQGYTVIAVAHRVSVAAGRMRPTDIVVKMADGMIQQVGSADEVLGMDRM